ALAASTPMKKMGFSFVWILKGEEMLEKFFPDEVVSVLLNRLKRSLFDAYADSFLRTHQDMTAKEVGKLLFMEMGTVLMRAKKIGVKLKAERHRSSPEKDELIRKHVATDIGIAAKAMGVDRNVVVHRANFLGLHIPKKRFIRWREEELSVLNQAVLDGKNDKEISGMLPNRTEAAVSLKRREIIRRAKKAEKAKKKQQKSPVT
ncbi:MAG: hypothetical protein NTY04_01635, partial [Candidatus Staskawiczbacteria bacterium]|nr:hypothetical protein [Candidatus Staskawiczbacteria bacterium]